MFTPVVGLEIHVQVKTKSKMFCRCEADYFNKEPNVNICPVCFGLPGALPVPNKLSFEKAVILALALNCSVDNDTKFDRKNYFYPDLPKGYQISQYDKPIGEEGFLEFEINGDSKKIAIERVHLEEDTAKSMHNDDGTTLIDYNKSGVPLAEIVTKPDFTSTEEVLAFARRLRQIVRYNDISDAEMQKGQMRFELNISLRKEGETGLPNYKVEVKNIGSISVLEKVLEKEIERQTELLEKGEEIKSQTRGLKDMGGDTLFQRSKETADDYRYFPEPDIAPIKIDEKWLAEIKNNLVEQPNKRWLRYISLGLNNEQSDIFVEDFKKGDWFDRVIEVIDRDEKITDHKKLVLESAKWIIGDISGIVEKKALPDLQHAPITGETLVYLLKSLTDKLTTASKVKELLSRIFEENISMQDIQSEIELSKPIDDAGMIDAVVKKVIDSNPKVVEDIAKNPNAIKFLVGQVMRETKGRVSPVVAEEKLKEFIAS